MRKAIYLILIIFAISCTNKNLFDKRIYIQNDNLFGSLKEGIPEKDTLIEVKSNRGTLLGIGKVALKGNDPTIFKFGLWREYDNKGVLSTEGKYKIGSYIDCCIAGACRVFYYYRIGNWKYFKKNEELDFELDFLPKEHTINTRCEGGDKLIFGLVETVPLKYWNKVTPNKIYELQKISFSRSYVTTTMTPLNGKIYIEDENEF